jgi:hypothetical protein
MHLADGQWREHCTTTSLTGRRCYNVIKAAIYEQRLHLTFAMTAANNSDEVLSEMANCAGTTRRQVVSVRGMPGKGGSPPPPPP